MLRPNYPLSLLLTSLAPFVPVFAQNAAKVDFERDIKPVLDKNCSGCHGAKAQMGGLRLDAKNTAMAGGLSG